MSDNKYQSGKIYKLTSEHTNKIYIGSTCKKLNIRLSNHKADYKRWSDGKRDYVTSFDLYKLGLVNIELLEEYSCNTNNELCNRERYWIEQNKDILINKYIPIRTEEETRIIGKEQNKQYREANKDEINKQRKQFREANKDRLKEINKVYREANKDKLKEQNKEYCEANKDKVKQKQKEYNDANREKIKERNKLYYEANKLKILEKRINKY
jgi:hypothetical protein